MKLFFIFGLSLLFAGTLFGSVYAQSTYVINIPSGASEPNAPYFWQVERDGSTTGDIEVHVGDTVSWENADTAPHTVTSGTPENGPDDIFDSSLFPPGQSFQHTFTELGNYPYFCLVHPWMVGEVMVTEGLSILPKVGKSVGDGMTTFDLEYRYSKLIDNPSINLDKKSITFELIGNAKTTNHNLFLKMPSALLDGPYVIWADGKKIDEFEHKMDGEMNLLTIPLTEKTKQLTIVGTSVVPEFGILAMAILAIGIISIIGLSKKSYIMRF